VWSSAGKFGGVFAAIPQPIVAAILCITFGMVGEYFLQLNRFHSKEFQISIKIHGFFSWSIFLTIFLE
jgi:xanthine/uracil permease